jgi:hypothetical protein
MKTKHRSSFLGGAALLLILTFATSAAMADEGDPPTRVARLAYAEGSVSLQPGGTDEWVDAPLNRPLTTGDAVWSDTNSRVELQLDGSLVRLSSRTSISFLNVADHVTQIQLTAGTMMVRVRRLDDDETYEIDTPNLALSLLQPGLYRVSVDDSGTATTVALRSGHAQVTGGGADFPVDAGQQVTFTGTDSLNANAQPYGPGASPFDVWSANRDVRWDHSVSANYVSPDVVGYTDLDDQGDWSSTPDYGYVWFPRRVQPGWAPYHYGHWAYIAPWGYTWVDDQPWGFAPFHYGRWISHNGAWGWVPCPPRPRGGEGYVRPVYAPALVAWVGAGAGVAWFALGPREVYVPSYPVSRAYVHNINVSNTIVNRTVVNNIYNTAINNRNVNVNVTNTTYVNRGVRGAIAATTTQAFTSAQPVATHTVQFDPRAGRVQAFAPAAVPTRQAVLGLGRQGAPRPPTALQTRPVVARMAPPPPPPTFERRQQAIQQNGGRPLSMAAVRQIQPQVAQRPAQIRIAPQVTQGTNRPGADLNPRRNDSPPVQRPVDRAPPAVQTSRPPQVANPAFPPQQHLQDQQQQQQERERQLARQQSQQQADQQRQQQIQALQQRQAQERDQQQERDRQQLARQQQEQDTRRQQQQADQQRQQQLEQQQRQQQSQALQQQQVQQQERDRQQLARQQQIQALQQQRVQEQLQRQQQPQQKPPQDNQTKPPVRHDEKTPKPAHAPDADH